MGAGRASSRGHRWAAVAAIVAVAATLLGCKPIVSEDPVDWTPHVLDGRVMAVAQVGDTVFIGGEFTRIREAGSSNELTRQNFAAFDARTGDVLDVAPAFDGQVEAILPAPDGRSIYVGGWFFTVDGRASRSLARLDVDTLQPVPGFTVPLISGRVRDLALAGGRLWIAGAFSHVNGVPQRALATLNAATGARDPYMGLAITGTQNGGTTQVLKVDVTPDGRRLLAIGNFREVAGRTARQVVALDLTGPAAALADWGTEFYGQTCAGSFESYVRDLDISDDGKYVVIVTTGGFGGGPPRSCDTASRFELDRTGLNLAPTWVDYTGGDTLTAVHVAPEAVYIGGHNRFLNNPFQSNSPGPGAVSRPGIAALDPRNGLPFSWNPERGLGVGVFDLDLTGDGLWVVSDTERIGGEFHGRVAMLPYAGGKQILTEVPGRFPGRVYLIDPPTGPENDVVGRFYDGTTVGPAEQFADGGLDFGDLRAATMVDGYAYLAFGDAAGSFVTRYYDGQQWMAAAPVDGADQLTPDAAWHDDVRSMTGLFYEDGRLYYTRSGDQNLRYRYFTPESQIVGAQRFTAANSIPGLDFRQVRGMFRGGNHLYWTDASGNLRRVVWANGAPVAGTVQLVSGPTVDGVDWRARAVFLDTRRVDPSLQATLVPECEPTDAVEPGAPEPEAPGGGVTGMTEAPGTTASGGDPEGAEGAGPCEPTTDATGDPEGGTPPDGDMPADEPQGDEQPAAEPEAGEPPGGTGPQGEEGTAGEQPAGGTTTTEPPAPTTAVGPGRPATTTAPRARRRLRRPAG